MDVGTISWRFSITLINLVIHFVRVQPQGIMTPIGREEWISNRMLEQVFSWYAHYSS